MKLRMWLFITLIGLISGCGRSNEEIRTEWKELVKTANYCEVDSECTYVTPGCPLGCFALTNSAEKAKLEAKAIELRNELHQDTSLSCNYSCVLPEDIGCQDGLCQER